jgi:hypothetical protein
MAIGSHLQVTNGSTPDWDTARMARALRFDVAGAWHHVMNRGHRGGTLFRDDADRRRFFLHLFNSPYHRMHPGPLLNQSPRSTLVTTQVNRE